MAVMDEPRVVGRPTQKLMFWGFGLGPLLRYSLLVAMAILVLTPIGWLVYSSFRTEAPGLVGSLTLEPWRDAFGSGVVFSALWTTFRITVPKVLLAIGLAVFFAWVITRTNTPGRRIFEPFLFFMWFTPALPMVLSWIVLLSPRSGLINQWLAPVLPFGFRFNAFSYEALVILGAVNAAPILFIFLAPAFRNMDSALEESAQMSGANLRQRLRHITFPLMLPSILTISALAVVLSLESFEIELLLGIPAGLYVFTARIYDLIFNQVNAQFGTGTALALVLLVITFALVLIQRRILARREFVTVTGKGYRPVPMDLGRWKWVTFAVMLVFCLVFGLLPIALLFVNSFMQVSGFLGFNLFTFSNWTTAVTQPALVNALKNTLLLGVGTASLGVVVVAVASYLVVKTNWKGRAAMDLIMWTPIAVPGLVLALGMLWAFVRLPIYSTIWILIIAFLIRGIPTGSRFFTSTMVQIGTELEESARIHGASWFRTFRSILIPLLLPAVLSAWVFLFVLSVRNVDAALLLGGPGTQVLSVSIFQLAQRGSFEVASALGIIQVGIIMLMYLLARALGARVSAVR